MGSLLPRTIAVQVTRELPRLPVARTADPSPTTRSAQRLRGPTGLGAAAHLRFPLSGTDPPADTRADTRAPAAARTRPGPKLYCPPALRDDPALGDAVNEQLVRWAEEIGIYAGNLDHVREANFGRLVMLAHPETEDADRLLAAAKCALAEWATDDHYCDDEDQGAVLEQLGSRLAIAQGVVDPARLPGRYATGLEAAIDADPVLLALRSALDHLSRYTDGTQAARLTHELAELFVGYCQEASWRATDRMPPVWEYLVNRQLNSFLPCITLVDAVAGYRLPAEEYSDPRVRGTLKLAGLAGTLVNDIYSMNREQGSGGVEYNLPAVIAAEEHCSLEEGLRQSIAIHDDLVRTYESEASALCLSASPALQRFLGGVWAWLGGSRQWHSDSGRYE